MVEQYAIYWEKLGLELGLKDFHINNIAENFASHKLRQVEKCCTAMLNKWLEIDISATWNKLNDAIKKIRRLPTRGICGYTIVQCHTYSEMFYKCKIHCLN